MPSNFTVVQIKKVVANHVKKTLYSDLARIRLQNMRLCTNIMIRITNKSYYRNQNKQELLTSTTKGKAH